MCLRAGLDNEMVKNFKNLCNMNIDNFQNIFLTTLNKLLNKEMPQQIKIVSKAMKKTTKPQRSKHMESYATDSYKKLML